MAYFSPETIEKVKKIDLLTFLKATNPEEVVYFSRGTYCTRTHDSLKISNGMWYWFSRGIGGKTALEYLIQVEEYSFTEAMNLLTKQLEYTPTAFINYKDKVKVDKLIMPEKSDNNDKAKLYLISRGIDESIIQECIDNELIYEQKSKGNVVFVGKDDNQHSRYAFIRGSNSSRYMHEASGSDKAYSFRLISNKKCDSVHLFESAIDLLSYATLNKNWYEMNLLSLGGIYKATYSDSEIKIPISVKKYLKQNQDITKIYLHFDNDSAGKLASNSFQQVLKKDYEVIDDPPKIGKDFNDYLCNIKQIKNNKIYERRNER